MKTRRRYIGHNKNDKAKSHCAFCGDDELSDRIVDRTDNLIVIPNRVSYDIFEGRRVLDHLMVLPTRHAEAIHDFTDSEKREMIEVIAKYEALGYSIYARGVGSISRSVKHQHTHLIKLSNQLPTFSVFIRRPYILFHK
jgi:diadenosine tetraphosphate (Ap4A) HIT family hydrolase